MVGRFVIFRIDQTPAHSDHGFMKNKKEQISRNSSYVQSLNGKWKFRYRASAFEYPADFFEGNSHQWGERKFSFL